jgi:hypothetical protein
MNDQGVGRLEKNEGKGKLSVLLFHHSEGTRNELHMTSQSFYLGKRLAISAMIDENGFDYDSIDVFECDADHSMNSRHFVDWMERAAFNLRKSFGPNSRICIVIDNAT